MSVDLAQLELDLIDLLKGQGLPVEEIRLIGLLGEGTRASAYSVMIDGVYHVLKVYDSPESLQAELKNLRKIIPKERFLFWWQEKFDGKKLNLAIIEVPEGRHLTSGRLSEAAMEGVAQRLAELHRIRYRQRVSVTGLKEELARYSDLFLKHIAALGRELGPYEALVRRLKTQLANDPDVFRANKVRVHGDMWWPNVIVAKEDVYLIDWESVHRADAAEDIAKLRVFTYGPRRDMHYFWQSPADGPKIAELVRRITTEHTQATGDNALLARLRHYLPFMCIHELGGRYVGGLIAQPMDQIVADEALALADDPLSPPPDLTKYGYWEDIGSKRLDQS